MAHIAWALNTYSGAYELLDENCNVIGTVKEVGASLECSFRGEVVGIRPDEKTALDLVEKFRREEQA